MGIPVIDRNDPVGRLARQRQRLGADPRFWGFDSSEVQVVRSGAIASGASTLYTVRTKKRALVRGGLVLIHNPTAAGITVDLHHVPSGGASGTSNKLGPTKTIAVDETATFLADTDLWHVMAGGDALVINPGSTGLNAWLAVIEEKATIASFLGGFQGNLGTSEVDLLVVPALRTAAIRGLHVFNTAGATRTLTAWSKASSAAGVDSNELVAQAVTTDAVAQIDLALIDTIDADGRISVKGSDTGLNVWANALLF